MTLPSHVSLLSGELPPVSGVRDNSGFPFDSSRHSFLPRLLAQGGYDTAAVVSASVLAAGTGLAGGFDVYDDRMPRAAGLGVEAKRPGTESVRAALDWVRGRAAGHPFFLFLHLYEPHAPYDPPEPFASRYRASPYDGAIAAADAAVGELLRELDRLGIYGRAAVMLLSDHGEGLGEHGEQQHGMYLYRTTLQVPLLLKLPGSLLAGGSVRAPAQLIDVAPTLAHLAGVPVPPGLAGENLLGLVEAGSPGAAAGAPGAAATAAAAAAGATGERPIYAETLGPRLHFGWSELTSLIEGRLHLQDGPDPELFDLAADPGETHDRLAGERRAFAAMRLAIRGIYRPPASPRPVDAETAHRLAALGYVATAGSVAQGPLPDPRRRRAEIETLDAAMADIGQRRWAAAVPLLQRLLAANPRMPDVHILLGTAWERIGRDREASESYQRAVAAADGSPVTALVAARALLQLGQVAEARSLATLARGGDPAAAAALAVDLDLAGGDLDAALQELRRGGGGVPGRPGASQAPAGMALAAPVLAAQQRAVGMALVEAGRSEEALPLLEPLAGGGDPALLDALAMALGDGGRDAEAAAVAGRVLAAAPRDARARLVLGTVALRREQVAEARRQLQAAVELDPRLAVAWNTLGVARMRLEGPGAALAAWRRAVEIAPDYWEALFNVGLASAEVGRRGEARAALERFVQKAPPKLFAEEIAKAREVLRQIGG